MIEEGENSEDGFKLFLEFSEYEDRIQDYVAENYPQLAWLLMMKDGKMGK